MRRTLDGSRTAYLSMHECQTLLRHFVKMTCVSLALETINGLPKSMCGLLVTYLAMLPPTDRCHHASTELYKVVRQVLTVYNTC